MNIPTLIIHLLLLILGVYLMSHGVKGLILKKLKIKNPYHKSSSNGFVGVILRSQLTTLEKHGQPKYIFIEGWSAIGRASLYVTCSLIVLSAMIAGVYSKI